jgi:NAD(P)-dependent dehydrogenase (short-subunit alcohol dehydrogenase family)
MNSSLTQKEITVVIGAGGIGQAIARRISSGRHILVANHTQASADEAARVLEGSGFEVTAMQADISDRAQVQAVVAKAQSLGPIKALVQAAGVSPSQAPIEAILKVDLFGTAVILEEFGKVIAEGGTGVVISSQSGYRMPALTAEQDALLATASPKHCWSWTSSRTSRARCTPTRCPNVATRCACAVRRCNGQNVGRGSIRSAPALSSPRWRTTSCTASAPSFIRRC